MSETHFDVVTFGETMASLMPVDPGPMEGSHLFKSDLGGAESNCAIGLARLNHSVSWISRLGADPFGKKILRAIRGEGVSVERVTFANDESTGLMFKENRDAGPRRVHYYRKNSAATRLSKDQFEGLSAKFLFVTGITPALSEQNRQFTFDAIDYFRASGAAVVFDPNLRTKLISFKEAGDLFRKLARKSDILLPSLAEAELMVETTDMKSSAQELLKLGPAKLAIKAGHEGAYYADGEGQGYVEPFATVEVDPIGAGDAFCAGVLSGMLENLPFKDAVKRGCAMGAFCVMGFGDYTSLPSREELAHFEAGHKIQGR